MAPAQFLPHDVHGNPAGGEGSVFWAARGLGRPGPGPWPSPTGATGRARALQVGGGEQLLWRRELGPVGGQHHPGQAFLAPAVGDGLQRGVTHPTSCRRGPRAAGEEVRRRGEVGGRVVAGATARARARLGPGHRHDGDGRGPRRGPTAVPSRFMGIRAAARATVSAIDARRPIRKRRPRGTGSERPRRALSSGKQSSPFGYRNTHGGYLLTQRENGIFADLPGAGRFAS